jgi:hypothetical protein
MKGRTARAVNAMSPSGGGSVDRLEFTKIINLLNLSNRRFSLTPSVKAAQQQVTENLGNKASTSNYGGRRPQHVR